eukprot:7273811-Ditylum_brightwellii.AAC.1
MWRKAQQRRKGGQHQPQRSQDSGMRKIKTHNGQLCHSTHVICRDTDGLYLKALMSASWQRDDKPRGVLIPSRTDLVTPPETYKQLLRNHNAYDQNATAVAVEGLPLMALDTEIAIGEEKVAV